MSHTADSLRYRVWLLAFSVFAWPTPSTQAPVGEPFRVTSFETPDLMVPRNIADVELSLNQDKLVLTMQELSGSIWVLDNVAN